MISEMKTRCYEDRLKLCNLTTLETRRIRGDQIEVFKMMHGYEGLDNKVRGYNWPLAKEHFKLDIGKYAFSQRTVNEWNKLPGECVNDTSVVYV